MPGQLFNLKRYFKKKEEPAFASDSEASVGEPASTQDANSPDGQQTTVVTKTTTQTTGQTTGAEPYSGIGKPPGGGEPYSGIGYPPASSAQAPTVAETGAAEPVIPPTAEKPAETLPQAASPVMQRKVGMDVLTRLTQRANTCLLTSVAKAKELKAQYIDTEHVLWGLLSDSGIYQLLSELKATPSEIQSYLEKSFKKSNSALPPQFSPRVKRVLELSLSAARSLGFEFISPEHLLLALAQEGEGAAAQTLTKFGITVVVLNQKITGKKEGLAEGEKKAASTVEQFCEDLTQKAREGKLDPVVGRSAEIERVIHILSRRTKNNPCLIGDAGVGKTAIVEGLAQRIAAGDVPETLLNKRILSLDLMSLVAGASHRGEFEERLKNLLKEIRSASGQIILFIDEIQNMVGAGAGSEGTLDVSNIMKPSLARGELQAIGTTTVLEYRKYIEKDPALERRFQPVQVLEPAPEQAMEMLRALRDRYEAYHKVSIADEAIEAAVRLSQKYIGDRFLPDKAVDLIDEAAAAIRLPAISLPEEIKDLQERIKRLEEEKKEAEKLKDEVRLLSLEKEMKDIQDLLEEKNKEFAAKKSTTTNAVGPEIIAEIVSRWSGIPISRLTESESGKLLKLEERIHERYINQEEAVAAVAEAVRRGRAGLTSGKRPIGSFIFMGPTGVGKTELCKALAELLFGSADLMVRLDMSEYMEKHEVAKLIGAPPGYVGYEEGGQLTEAVRRHPYSVVLLDEIEKAHPDVFNILLQILDDGRLTDNKGHVISFKNTIICCTSNIGTGLIQREMLEEGKITFVLPALSTYALTPTGREIVTLRDRYWLRGKEKKEWKTALLSEYFSGNEVTGAEPLEPKIKFPETGWETHLFSPKGEEMISAGGRIWRRKSPVAKEWETLSLIDYFKDQTVENASPDDPALQLPTAKLSTWAIAGDGCQIISLNDRVWIKEKESNKTWLTQTLKEYFQDCLALKTGIAEAQKDNAKTQKGTEMQKQEEGAQEDLEKAQAVATEAELALPTQKLDVHLFTPTDEEIVIVGDRFWKRKSREAKEWTTGKLTDLFTSSVVANADAEKTEEQLPLGQEIEKAKEEQKMLENEKFAVLAEQLLAELKKFFRPEVLNRFDEVIVFRPLSAQDVLQIVDLQFQQLAKLLEEQHIGLEVTPLAKQQIAILGYDPVYGARPLRRAIQRYVENPISSMIIKEEAKAGETILVDFDGNDFVFTVKKPREEPSAVATKKYVCLDCGREFEVPPETHESHETYEPHEVSNDMMTPAVANFADDLPDVPAGQPDSQPTGQSGDESVDQVEDKITGQPEEAATEPPEIPEIPEAPAIPPVVCPYCGSTNVKPVEEVEEKGAEVSGEMGAETTEVEVRSGEVTEETETKDEQKGLEQTEEKPEEPGLEASYGEKPGAETPLVEPPLVESAPESSAQPPDSPQADSSATAA
jgi:ATP-dependent Clp protease ATP-binding subunit ClpC